MSEKLRPLTWAAYAVAFLFIAIPFADAVASVLPVRVGDVTWRFGAAGLVSRSLMTPLFGMLLALVTAGLMGHRVMAKVVSAFAFIGALLGVLAMVMFSLDIVQARTNVRVEALTQFDVASATAFAKYVLGTITAILLGVGGWKVSRRRPGRAAERAPKADRDAAAEEGVLIG